MFISPENIAARGTVTTSPSVHAQYPIKNVIDGQLGRMARVPTNPGNWNIQIDLLAFYDLDCFALFDVYGKPTSFSVYFKTTSGGTYSLHATGNQANGAIVTRDGANHCYLKTGGLNARWIQLTTSMPSVGFGQAGEAWIGKHLTLGGRDPTDRQDQILNANTNTIGPSGIVSAIKLGPTRRGFRLHFEKIGQGAEHAEFETLRAAADGAVSPVLLAVDGQPYHGRLQNDPTWAVDAPVIDSHDLTFTESGRAPLVLG